MKNVKYIMSYSVEHKWSCLQAVKVNIPPAHHMTALSTLDPAMFGLMRSDAGALLPTEIIQMTCRIKSHLS